VKTQHIFEFSSPSVYIQQHFLWRSVNGAAGYATLLLMSCRYVTGGNPSGLKLVIRCVSALVY